MANLAYFDRFKAATYAKQYAHQYNPVYADLSQAAGIGEGDCTNFVSQAMLAGGWAMIPGAAHDRSCWWYKRKPDGGWWEHYISGFASNTWVGAASFSVFLASSPRVARCAESDLTLADIVQARRLSDDTVVHSLLVTSGVPGGVAVSYHTRNVLDEPLKDVKEYFGSNFEFLFWKVADVYFDTSRPPMDARHWQ